MVRVMYLMWFGEFTEWSGGPDVRHLHEIFPGPALRTLKAMNILYSHRSMSDDIRLLTPDEEKKVTQLPEAFAFSLTVNNVQETVLFSMKLVPPLGFD